MEENGGRRKPVPIMVVCVVGGVAILIAALNVVTRWQSMLDESPTGAAAAVAGLVISAACLYGFWRMKRIAVIVFGLAFVARVLYGLLGGPPLGWARMIGPTLILLVGLAYWRRMD